MIYRLEKIRFSITRLKRADKPILLPCLRKTWKDKILDYEIETNSDDALAEQVYQLTWKDKILDYEIETGSHAASSSSWILQGTWKDKILDYEIET